MAKMKICDSREEWLQERKDTIGGSEAAAVLGKSPWLTNTQLWEDKTGRKPRGEISNEATEYGHAAEDPLRELLKLDFPQLTIGYFDGNIWESEKYPWAHASLDAWCRDEKGRFGVIELKTATITRGLQLDQWMGRIPDHYYAQVLHYMAVTDAAFALVKAQLKRPWDGKLDLIETRHYWIEREEVEDDIQALMEAERSFWASVKTNTRPALVLPEI